MSREKYFYLLSFLKPFKNNEKREKTDLKKKKMILHYTYQKMEYRKRTRRSFPLAKKDRKIILYFIFIKIKKCVL